MNFLLRWNNLCFRPWVGSAYATGGIFEKRVMPAGKRWSWNADIVVDGNINKCGNYALSDGTKVKIMPVNHPSVGYSWDYWHRVIAAFLG